jgi:hypothetical protein
MMMIYFHLKGSTVLENLEHLASLFFHVPTEPVSVTDSGSGCKKQ